MLTATASQTIGPYWHLIEDPTWSDATRFGADGDAITLTGTITDGQARPVADALIEIWQSSPPATDDFPAFARARTDAQGRFRFTTLMPGPVPGRGNAHQAPHLAVTILGRGLLTALHTRVYFDGEPLNDADPVLSLIEDPAARRTLIARQTAPATWTLDICLQGAAETVFMAV
jgi:protocatechuate 3,4-dioxygenase alpha subunit